MNTTGNNQRHRLHRSRAASRRGGATPACLGLCLVAVSIGGVSPVFAQSTAGSTQQAAEPAPIGRLFLTPAQRRALDELRNREPEPEPVAIVARPEPEPLPVPDSAPPPPVVSELTLNGLIIRRNGPSSAWVNGAQIPNGSVTREGVVVRTGRGGVRMVLPSGTKTLRLRPGQRVDVVNGSVLEPYQVPRNREDEDALTAELAERLDALEAAETSPAEALAADSANERRPPDDGPAGSQSARQLLDDLFSRLR